MSNNSQVQCTTSFSPATCWRGLFSRNCQIHSLSGKSCRNRARNKNKNMQNKANLQNSEMNVSTSKTSYYENFRTFCSRKNKAKQSQNKANLKNDEMNVTPLLTKGYENLLTFCLRENKAKQTQNEPNFSSKLASFFPYRLCFSPKIAVEWLAKNISYLCFLWQKYIYKLCELCGLIKKSVCSVAKKFTIGN